jgi:hypothetical protein
MLKYIYNVQLDLSEREKKKNNIIIYGSDIEKLENNNLNHEADKIEAKINYLLTVANVDLS